MPLRIWVCKACDIVRCEQVDFGEKPTECDQPEINEKCIEPQWILEELDVTKALK